MNKYLLVFFIFLFSSIGVISIQAQTCASPAPNMISWWRAEGNALDAKNLHNGTLQNGATFANGRVGQAFHFDGVDDAILLGNQSGLQPSSITVESWVKFDSVAVGEIENVFAKWGFDATVDSYLLGVYNDGTANKLFGAIGDGSTGDSGLSGGGMTVDIWNHVAMTYNAADGVHKIYQNGVEVGSRIRPNGIFPTVSNAYFARQDAAGRIFSGLIDELAVYSRALSQTEIQAIFNAGTAGKCSSTNQTTGNFRQKQQLFANPVVREQFGWSVAVSGDTMVVGANGHDTTPNSGINIGAAYVFVRSGGSWVQQAKLQAGDGASGDEFGYSVAISGDTIVVGSWRSNAPTSNSGAAYVFTRTGTTWTQQQKLTASDGAADDEFGISVAVSGNTIAVGSHRADQPSGSGDAGAVYTFNRSGTVWTQTQKLIPNGAPLFSDFLGFSVALSGETLVAGASGDQDPARTNRGTVYVYSRNGGTWSQQQKLIVPDNPNNPPSTQLGSSVAIDGDTIVSGALGDTPTTGQPNHGSAYIFVRNGTNWSLQQKLNSSDGATSDFFGWSVAVRGDTVAVGARFDDTTAGADAGGAYVFTRNGATWTEKQKLTAGDAAQFDRFGTSVSLNADGTLAVGAPEKSLPQGQTAVGTVYVFSNIGKSTPFDFDGDGKADIGIFRPSDGSWWYSRSLDNQFRVFSFGISTDLITPGDYTGDGKADIAVFRPSTGEWFIQRSEDNSFFSFPFGTSEDVPAPADYDGDGKTDPAVFRPSAVTWFIRRSSDLGTTIVTFGINGDKPVAADYDGDGKADIAIFRPSNGSWWHLRSSDSQFRVYNFGTSTDKPVQGDFTGDGKADIAVFRPSTGEWFIQRSEDNSFFSFPFGTSGDIPAPGDYDGDGKFDASVFRPSTANWFVQRSTAGILINTFGTNGDRPIPNSFVP